VRPPPRVLGRLEECLLVAALDGPRLLVLEEVLRPPALLGAGHRVGDRAKQVQNGIPRLAPPVFEDPGGRFKTPRAGCGSHIRGMKPSLAMEATINAAPTSWVAPFTRGSS